MGLFAQCESLGRAEKYHSRIAVPLKIMRLDFNSGHRILVSVIEFFETINIPLVHILNMSRLVIH